MKIAVNTLFGNMHDQENSKDEWLTPPNIIRALGGFDLDPCAPVKRVWETARNYYTILDDGLSKDWFDRVWLNPPYGNQTEFWIKKLADHGNGIALIYARTETDIFFLHVWGKADAILFLRKRIRFYNADGTRAKHSSGAPSVLIAYGKNNADVLKRCDLDGKFIDLKNG